MIREEHNRRTFMRHALHGAAGLGLAPIAFAGADASRTWRGVARPLATRPRARRVVFLCMAGGPSQFESFDHKPELARRDGEPIPTSFTKGQPIAQLQGQRLRLYAPQYPFHRYGESGQEISTLFPHTGSIADRLCIVRSMHTDQINHDPAHTVMNTGTSISGRPSDGRPG